MHRTTWEGGGKNCKNWDFGTVETFSGQAMRKTKQYSVGQYRHTASK